MGVRCFARGEQAPTGSLWPVHEAQAAHVPESGRIMANYQSMSRKSTTAAVGEDVGVLSAAANT